MTIPAGLSPYFKGLGMLSLVLIAGDTWLSTKFGASIAWEMAVVYAAISIASGMLLVIAWYFRKLGVRALGNGLACAWAVAFVFNVWSNMGVSTSNRMGEVQRAGVMKTIFEGHGKKITENENSLKLFNEQLASLLEQNQWAGTVTADGLKKQVEDLKRSEAAESRLGGCGQKCRAIQNEIARLQGQIAVAEQRSDLTNRIEATKRTLASLRNDLSTTDAGISATANQSTLYAKLISWDLAANPDEAMVVVANEATGIGSAFVLALLATAVTFAGAWPHLAAVGPITGTPTPTHLYQQPATIARQAAPVPPVEAMPIEVAVRVETPEPPKAAEPKATELEYHPVNAVHRRKVTSFAQRCADIADRHTQRIAMVRAA